MDFEKPFSNEKKSEYKDMFKSAVGFKKDGFNLKHKDANLNLVGRYFADKKASDDFDKMVKRHKEIKGGDPEMKKFLGIARWAINKILTSKDNNLTKGDDNRESEEEILKFLKENDFKEGAQKIQDDENAALETGNYGEYEIKEIETQDNN